MNTHRITWRLQVPMWRTYSGLRMLLNQSFALWYSFRFLAFCTRGLLWISWDNSYVLRCFGTRKCSKCLARLGDSCSWPALFSSYVVFHCSGFAPTLSVYVFWVHHLPSVGLNLGLTTLRLLCGLSTGGSITCDVSWCRLSNCFFIVSFDGPYKDSVGDKTGRITLL